MRCDCEDQKNRVPGQMSRGWLSLQFVKKAKNDMPVQASGSILVGQETYVDNVCLFMGLPIHPVCYETFQLEEAHQISHRGNEILRVPPFAIAPAVVPNVLP